MYIDPNIISATSDTDCKLFLDHVYHIVRSGINEFLVTHNISAMVGMEVARKKVKTSFKIKQSHYYNCRSFFEYKKPRALTLVLYCCPLGQCFEDPSRVPFDIDFSSTGNFCFNISYGLKTKLHFLALQDNFTLLCKILRDIGEYETVVDLLSEEVEKIKLLHG